MEFFKLSASTGHVAYCGTLQIPPPTTATDLHRGRVKPEVRLVMRHNVGGPLRDFIITGYAVPVVVSDKVVAVLSGLGCSGWDTFPVEVYDKTGELVDGFHGFAVRGACGAIDWSRSEPVPITRPTGDYPSLKGMLFDEASWDGSDVFCPDNGGWILCYPSDG